MPSINVMFQLLSILDSDGTYAQFKEFFSDETDGSIPKFGDDFPGRAGGHSRSHPGTPTRPLQLSWICHQAMVIQQQWCQQIVKQLDHKVELKSSNLQTMTPSCLAKNSSKNCVTSVITAWWSSSWWKVLPIGLALIIISSIGTPLAPQVMLALRLVGVDPVLGPWLW